MGSKSPSGAARNSAPPSASEQVKRIRSLTNLSQAKFAKVIDVELGTLQNWEQGRRNPTGPARALLRAIENDPENVLAALIG